MIYIRLMCADPVVFVLIPECNAIGGYMFNAMIPSPSSKWNNIIPIRWQCGIGWFLSVCVCDCGEHCSVKCRSRSLSPHCEAATSNNRSPNQCLRTFGRQTAAASGYVCEICGVAKHFNTWLDFDASGWAQISSPLPHFPTVSALPGIRLHSHHVTIMCTPTNQALPFSALAIILETLHRNEPHFCAPELNSTLCIWSDLWCAMHREFVFRIVQQIECTLLLFARVHESVCACVRVCRHTQTNSGAHTKPT